MALDIDWQKMIFFTVGGLGLFLIGMGMMSAGLKDAAGLKLRKILGSMTRRPMVGFGMGVFVTALVQSSSMTTVMVIGMVNAGLLTLRQSICVIFGANVGTTITAWIVSLTRVEGFSITEYALPAVAVGFLFQVLGRSNRTKSYGRIIVGLAILFIGLGFMKNAFEGVERISQVVEWLESMGSRPIIALLAGMALTMCIQSSSAAIAIFQVMAGEGAFGGDWVNVLNVAIPFMLGSDIGTTITAQIASLQTNVPARRAACVHTMFNVIGVAVVLPFFYMGVFTRLVLYVSWWDIGQETILPTIAVANTMFKLFCSMLFLPLTGQVERAVKLIVPQRESDFVQPVVLEARLLNTPAIALQQAHSEIIQMARRAKKAVTQACDGMMRGDRRELARARETEDVIDNFQTEITSYLVALSGRQLSDEVALKLPVMLHMVNDLERVGDHAVNIVEIADRKIDRKLDFSDEAIGESSEMIHEVVGMIDHIIDALEGNSREALMAALMHEGKLNRMQVSLRRSHIQRMTDGMCTAEVGLIFIDLVDNLEKIGDHLTNIAQSVMGGIQWEGIDGNTLSGEFRAITEEEPGPEQ